MIKERQEATVRASVESRQTRTWHLTIDIIVQAGRYKTGKTTPAKFIVEG
ncbi:MAG: hypothetical protein LBH01_09445 [Verrucomicrobiales bacterium]|nr:hypothetical protein [Verrucomicrobiales bacterium]